MAENQTDVLIDEHGTSYFETDGNKYYMRHCFKKDVHESHFHKSYYFEKTPKKDNAWCNGKGEGTPTTTGKNPYVNYTHTPKVKKDYSEDTLNFPVSDPITVEEARAIAYDMHKDQKDKAGEEYWKHLMAVEMGVQVLGGSDEERVAALFHDAEEDFHTTFALLKKINVTDNSLVMIEALSKRTSEKQTDYLERIKKAGSTLPKELINLGITEETIEVEKTSKGACRVKIADLLHNTRHDRIQHLRDKKQNSTADRLLKKYRPALAALMMELGMIIDTDDQKKIATVPQGSATGAYSSGYTTTYSSTSAEACKDHNRKYCWSNTCKDAGKNKKAEKQEKDTRAAILVHPKDLMVGDLLKDKGGLAIKSIDVKVSKTPAAKSEKQRTYSLITMSDNTTHTRWWTTYTEGKVMHVEVLEETAEAPAVVEDFTPAPQSYKVAEVLPGDWVREWDAPVIDSRDIQELPKRTVFMLANGEEKTVRHYENGTTKFLHLYAANVWRHNHTLFSDIETDAWDAYFDMTESLDQAAAEEAEEYAYALEQLEFHGMKDLI